MGTQIKLYFHFLESKSKKISPRVFFGGGKKKTPIFQYSNPSPGRIFKWIVLEISMHTYF